MSFHCGSGAASTVPMHEAHKRTTTAERQHSGDSRDAPSELRLSIHNVEIKVPLDDTTKRETEDFLHEIYRLSQNEDPEDGAAESVLDLGLRIEEQPTTMASGPVKEERKLGSMEEEEEERGWDPELEAAMTSTEISRSNYRIIRIKK
jgi:hypothetical protein